MRELSEYTDELHRRVELKVQTRRQHRIRTLAVCAPLVLCVVVGALTLPRMLARLQTKGSDAAPPDQDGLTGIVADNLPEGAAPVVGTEATACQQRDPADAIGEQDGAEAPEELPADFSFRFVWGCYGISSYDSRTGTLVKTTDATHPENYVTSLELNEEQEAEVWKLLSALALETYPANYDPYNDPASDQRVASEPNRDLILTLRAGGKETTVSCRGICLDGTVQGYDQKARSFLKTCDALTELLTGTPEWAALPDYEFFYE